MKVKHLKMGQIAKVKAQKPFLKTMQMQNYAKLIKAAPRAKQLI